MKYLLSIIFALAVSALGIFVLPQETNAANKSDFNPGRIIDDAVFYNSGSMSATQIQKFLESKNPSCDYNGTQSAADWGYPSLTHAQLAEKLRTGQITISGVDGSKFHAPPYKCLTRYNQSTPQMEAASGYCSAINAGTRTAAQIIKDIANACGINPQVLVILLEKEQSLVTDKWPLNRQLQNATGFACPDTAPCDPAYGGFFYQVYHAARQFKVYQANPNNYNYRAGRNNNIYWHPDLTRCGSSTVYIQNQATAALYIYTPYRPNAAALNNLYGTGDSCSSYGNRNFWRIFTDWFGSTRYTTRGGIAIKYEALGGASSNIGMPTSNEVCKLSQNGCRQTFENGVIYWTSATDAQAMWGGILEHWKSIGSEKSYLGYPTGGEVKVTGGVYQQFQKGRIYWKSGIGAWNIHGGIGDRYIQAGASSSSLGFPIAKESCGLANGGCSQAFETGKIVWSSSSKAWNISGVIYQRWQQARADNGYLGYPTGAETVIQGGTYQQFQKGRIYLPTDSEVAYSAHGGIGEYYVAIQAHTSSIGLPMNDEICFPSKRCEQSYQNGKIIWGPGVGAQRISPAIEAHWNAIGAENSYLGYPTKAESSITGGIYQQFQKGRIYWKSGIGAWNIHGGIGDRYIQLGAEKSSLGYPKSVEIVNSSTGVVRQEFEHGTLFWSSSKGVWL